MKKPLNSDYMRRAYYELSDKLEGLKDASKKLGDENIEAEVKKLEQARDAIYQLLEESYLWD